MGRDNKWCDNFGFLKWYKPLSLLFELGFLNMQVELTSLHLQRLSINEYLRKK